MKKAVTTALLVAGIAVAVDSEVPADLEAAAQEAIQCCPEQAISEK